jgi:hypothetical protein
VAGGHRERVCPSFSKLKSIVIPIWGQTIPA